MSIEEAHQEALFADKATANEATSPSWSPMEIPPDVAPRGFYVGTSGYHFDDWIGRFNPPKTSGKGRAGLSDSEEADQDRLRFYLKYFAFVEINNTFYREASAAHLESLLGRSRASTQFSVKVHRDISHTAEWDSQVGRELMRRHVEAAAPLVHAGKLYGFLIQLEDHVRLDDRKLDYLVSVASESIEGGIDVHVELRHRSWHVEQALQTMNDNGIGICNTEIPPVPHAFPLKSYATSSKGYVRYSGRNLENWYPKGRQESCRDRIAARNARYDYDYSQEQIEERVLGQLALRQKVECVAVAYNNHYNAQAVMNAIQNMKLLNAKLRAVQQPSA